MPRIADVRILVILFTTLISITGFYMSNMALRDAVDGFLSISATRLSAQEETFVMRRVVGMNPIAAARMAGYPKPQAAAEELANSEKVNSAIAYIREANRLSAINAGAINFTKDDATSLYLQAHARADAVADEIRCIDSLVKLHGLAAPEKREIIVTSREQLEVLDDEALMRMSGNEFSLSPSEYGVVHEEPTV